MRPVRARFLFWNIEFHMVASTRVLRARVIRLTVKIHSRKNVTSHSKIFDVLGVQRRRDAVNVERVFDSLHRLEKRVDIFSTGNSFLVRLVVELVQKIADVWKGGNST